MIDTSLVIGVGWGVSSSRLCWPLGSTLCCSPKHPRVLTEKVLVMRRIVFSLVGLIIAPLALAQEPKPAPAATPTPSAPPTAPAAPGAAQPLSPDAQRGLMRTDASRMLSEADQFITNGQNDRAFERLAAIKQRYLSVLTAEEINTVEQQFEQARSALGLQVLADGRILPMTKDEDIDGLLTIVPGTYASDVTKASETSPAITYNAARVLIDGLTNAVYFEVARADDPATPFRQGIISFVRVGGKVRMRVMDIGNPSLREAIVGLWAAPEVFPSFSISNLSINVELEVARTDDGGAYVAKTLRPFPTFAGGAVELTSRMRISSDGLSINDRGLDGSGTLVWGAASAEEDGTMLRRTASTVNVTRQGSGLVIVDLVPGEKGGYALGPGGDIAVHFSQWTTEGLKLDSSRSGTRGAARVRYPVGSIPGLDQGLAGITKGARRRVVIPPELGYGSQGRGPVPANATLVFDLEAMWLQAPQEVPPQPPTGGPEGNQPAGPQPQPGAAPPKQNP